MHEAAECDRNSYYYEKNIEAVVYMMKEGGADVNAVCQARIWHVRGNTYTQVGTPALQCCTNASNISGRVNSMKT